MLGPLDCSWGVRGPLAQTIPGRLGWGVRGRLDQNQIQVGFKQLTKSSFEQHGRVRNRCETVGVERNCPCRIMSDLAHTRVCASLVSSLVFGAVFAYQTAHGRPAVRTTPNHLRPTHPPANTIHPTGRPLAQTLIVAHILPTLQATPCPHSFAHWQQRAASPAAHPRPPTAAAHVSCRPPSRPWTEVQPRRPILLPCT